MALKRSDSIPLVLFCPLNVFLVWRSEEISQVSSRLTGKIKKAESPLDCSRVHLRQLGCLCFLQLLGFFERPVVCRSGADSIPSETWRPPAQSKTVCSAPHTRGGWLSCFSWEKVKRGDSLPLRRLSQEINQNWLRDEEIGPDGESDAQYDCDHSHGEHHRQDVYDDGFVGHGFVFHSTLG